MVVTVGFFDGVHLGHRRVLRSLCESGESAAVVTFWPHPRVVLQQDARDFVLLSSLEEKLSLIRSFGVEDVRCVDFTKGFIGASKADIDSFEGYGTWIDYLEADAISGATVSSSNMQSMLKSLMEYHVAKYY